jgi:hypothetical protein
MRLDVRFQVDVPDDMPLDLARKWIGFEIGAYADLRIEHPQMECDLDALRESLDVYPAFRSRMP